MGGAGRDGGGANLDKAAVQLLVLLIRVVKLQQLIDLQRHVCCGVVKQTRARGNSLRVARTWSF